MSDPTGSSTSHPDPLPDADAGLVSLGRVTGELLHDIVGLVGILSSRAALVREDARVGRPVTEEINRISKDCDYLKDMVADILDELRGGGRSPEIGFLVGPTLQEVVDRWLTAAPSVTTRLTSSAPATARVTGRKSFFARAMANLLQNAARHARSEINLSIDPHWRGRRSGVRVTIEDDGDGVLPELRERIFEPLARGDFGGTGLGLSFVQWAVQQLGGDIVHLDGVELGGARFEIWLPAGVAGEAGRQDAAAVSRKPQGTLSGKCIALIDDEPMIRRMYRRLLEKAGARVEEVVPKAGERCAVFASEIAASEPDVILLDLNLSGWSGIEIWEALAERHPRCARRVLFLSGDVWSEKDIGEDSPPLISKLVEWDELIEQIEKVVKEEPTSRW